jgi:hypothetical protein
MATARYRHQRLLQLRFRRVYVGSICKQARDAAIRIQPGQDRAEQQEDVRGYEHDDGYGGYAGYARNANWCGRSYAFNGGHDARDAGGYDAADDGFGNGSESDGSSSNVCCYAGQRECWR